MTKGETDIRGLLCRGMGELYEWWFECDKCKYDHIRDDDNYCAKCGTTLAAKESNAEEKK